jgi:hypothetical protein
MSLFLEAAGYRSHFGSRYKSCPCFTANLFLTYRIGSFAPRAATRRELCSRRFKVSGEAGVGSDVFSGPRSKTNMAWVGVSHVGNSLVVFVGMNDEKCRGPASDLRSDTLPTELSRPWMLGLG